MLLPGRIHTRVESSPKAFIRQNPLVSPLLHDRFSDGIFNASAIIGNHSFYRPSLRIRHNARFHMHKSIYGEGQGTKFLKIYLQLGIFC